MNKFLYLFCLLFVSTSLLAGNPDRQGEAGAYELLMNPWARSAGLHTMQTANITGVEAMRLNVAGLSRINRTEVYISNALYLRGSDINMNAFGISQKAGENGAFGLSIMAVDFGDITVTTTDQPEGTGATFSPSFFHIGAGYSHTFENKVSVGILLRGISETTAELTAFGFAIDAGVQYVSGPQDNFKFGISLRNVGSPMRFGGQGLSVPSTTPDGTGVQYQLTYDQRAASFELPSVLNIGASYDINFGTNRLTFVGNFTANSFSQDQIGAGLEYSLNDLFQIRGGYKYEFGSEDEITAPLYTGVSAGISLNIPISKENPNKLGIDYAYRQTRLLDGTHNIGVRIAL